MEPSQLFSWIGITTGTFIGPPQLIRTIQTKRVGDLPPMVLDYALLIVINALQLFLIWTYREGTI